MLPPMESTTTAEGGGGREALLGEMGQLNLVKYIDEVATALAVDRKFKVSPKQLYDTANLAQKDPTTLKTKKKNLPFFVQSLVRGEPR